MKNFKPLLLSSLVLAAACGSTNNDSQTQDISSPGPVDQNNKLYWIEDSVVYRANCESGELPVRANCSSNVATVAREASVDFVNNTIEDNIQNLTKRKETLLRILLNDHPTIVHSREKIAGLESEITTKKSQITSLRNNIDSTLANIQELSEQISDYNRQIRAVDDRLNTNPGNAELLRLRESLLEEQRELIDRKNTADHRLDDLQHQRTVASHELSSLERELIDEKDILDRRLRTLNVENDATHALDENIATERRSLNLVSGVFQKLNDSAISYRAHQLTSAEKIIFSKIESSFTAHIIRFSNGYVEVFYRNSWGGVCDDNFDRNDGKVLCRMAGLEYSRHSSTTGPDNFHFDSVRCNGNEESIFSCSKSTTDDCNSSENVRLVCR